MSEKQTSQDSQKLSNSEKQDIPEQEQISTTQATGLEDYAHWIRVYKDHKREGDRSFRRGRIWA